MRRLKTALGALSLLLLAGCGGDTEPVGDTAANDLQGRIAAACGYDRDDLVLGRMVDGSAKPDGDLVSLITDQATSDFVQAAMVNVATGSGGLIGYLQEWVAGDGGRVIFLSQDQTAHCSNDKSTHSVAA